ncbi:hypothetical protein [Komagataeibacter diospyri]|uniref:hypothetical protein n=1 Tax=Komagataeibacter diospyri TaxID=1932662 RepID=UPI0018743064|nr:hypothetical protein [Komagataeibacter diospyri]
MFPWRGGPCHLQPGHHRPLGRALARMRVVGGVRALCWTWHKLRCGASDPQWVWIAPVGRDGGAWFSDQPACRACFTAPPMGNDPGQG